MASLVLVCVQAGGVETSKVSRDLSRLSKASKLQVLLSEAPELLTLLEEFREKLAELKGRVEPLVTLARKVRACVPLGSLDFVCMGVYGGVGGVEAPSETAGSAAGRAKCPVLCAPTVLPAAKMVAREACQSSYIPRPRPVRRGACDWATPTTQPPPHLNPPDPPPCRAARA
jgi:hypothetical protein